MQHILGQVRRCVEDYHMIEAGDKVAVGVSGGKGQPADPDGSGPAAGLLSPPLSGGGHHAGDRHAGHEF